MKWDGLTMSQKQALMKIYVNNGITNLDEIRNHYNRFGNGGKEEKPKSNDRKLLYDNYILEGDTIKEKLSTSRPAPAIITAVRKTRKNRFDGGGFTNMPQYVTTPREQPVIQTAPTRMERLKNRANMIGEAIGNFLPKKEEAVTNIVTDRVLGKAAGKVGIIGKAINLPDTVSNIENLKKALGMPYSQGLIDAGKGQTLISNSVNRFGGGGPEDKAASERPTRQEYIQSKIDNVKNKAIEYSYFREKPTPWYTNCLREVYNKEAKQWEIIPDYTDSCLYTFTDSYSQDGINRRVPGNLSMQATPLQYGFKPIEKEELQKGDLVQKLNSSGESPIHAMMYVGENEIGRPLYNYSAGTEDGKYVKEGNYYPDLGGYLYYTFVGTPKDKDRWTKEYFENYNPMDYVKMASIEDALRESNKKKCGGKIKKNKK